MVRKKTAIEAVDEALGQLILMGCAVPPYNLRVQASELPEAIDAAIVALDGNPEWEVDIDVSAF
jgi:hypothetical protein